MHFWHAVLLVLSILAAPVSRAVDVGQQAPGFELAGLSGTTQLEKFRGKTVYLDFWASWCPPCKLSFPWMNQIQTTYANQGLQVIAINLDKRKEDALTFLGSAPVLFPIAFDPDGTTPKNYAIKAMPTSVLIGPDGKILWVHRGFRLDDRMELERKIQHALRPH